MRALRQLAVVLLTVALTLAIVFDGLVLLQILGALFTHGLRGVNGWIVHIGMAGRITVVEVERDSMTLKFPSRASAYANFACFSAFLAFVTGGSWWGRRALKNKAQPRD